MPLYIIYMACRDVPIYLHDMQKCSDTQICTDWHRCADIMRRDMNFCSTNIKRYTICKLLLSYARSILYAKHSYPSPYSIILLSFHHCSSQTSQRLSVSSCAHTCLLNRNKAKQKLSPCYAAANLEPGLLVQFLAYVNLE